MAMGGTVTVARDDLDRTLALLIDVVEQRNTIPILANACIEAMPGKLTFSATDLDNEVTCQLPAEGDAKWSTTVSAHVFRDIIAAISAGAVIDLGGDDEDGDLVLRAGDVGYRLRTLPAGDYPELKRPDYAVTFAMAAPDLAMMIDRTQFAISTEEARYYLNGIYIHLAGEGKDRLRAVATNGHQLSLTEILRPEGLSDAMPAVIIPRVAVKHVARLIKGQESVTVSIGDRGVRFESGGSVLTSKTIDGTYPDYPRVIPSKDITRTIIIDRTSLAEALDLVRPITSDRNPAVLFDVAESGRVTISASQPDVGVAKGVVQAESWIGDPLKIAFNRRYLAQGVMRFGEGPLRLRFTEAGGPFVMDREGADGDLYVQAAMRV
jgi:DNA polymerase-3 subunit beta